MDGRVDGSRGDPETCPECCVYWGVRGSQAVRLLCLRSLQRFSRRTMSLHMIMVSILAQLGYVSLP